jgi:hypothetical protein
VTVKHTKEHIQPFPADKPRKPKAKEPGEPDSVRITTSGHYVLFIGGTTYEGIPNALGELAKGEEITDDMEDLHLDPSPSARWGKGYKGPRREAYPLPDEYSFEDEYTPLDVTTVEILTSLFSKKQNHKAHPSLAAWGKRLGINDKQWDITASRYNSSLLTPRDYHLHFKHITHRRIATNNRFADQSSICRFCHQYEETSMPLGRCPCLTAIFGTINKAVGFVPTQNMTVQQKTLNTLFGHPHKDTPPCIAHLYMIAWRFIITDFYQLHFNSAMPPFDITRAYNIYARTLERYTLLVMAKAHRTRTVLLARQRSDNLPSTRMVRRTNKMIAPLSCWTNRQSSPNPR